VRSLGLDLLAQAPVHLIQDSQADADRSLLDAKRVVLEYRLITLEAEVMSVLTFDPPPPSRLDEKKLLGKNE